VAQSRAAVNALRPLRGGRPPPAGHGHVDARPYRPPGLQLALARGQPLGHERLQGIDGLAELGPLARWDRLDGLQQGREASCLAAEPFDADGLQGIGVGGGVDAAKGLVLKGFQFGETGHL